MNYGFKRLVCLAFVTALFLSILPSFSFNGQRVKAAAVKTGTVTVDKLNVRTGPGTSYDKVLVGDTEAYLTLNQTVTVTGEKDGWYKVAFVFNKKATSGYVMGEYLKVTQQEVPDNTPNKEETPKEETPDKDGIQYKPISVPGIVTADKLRVRTGPGTNYKQLTVEDTAISLEKDTKITLTGDTFDKGGDKWYQISFTYKKTKQSGYVLSDYVKLALTSSVKGQISTKNAVKLRTGAGTNKDYLTYNGKVMSVKDAKKCTIYIEKTKNEEKWFKIKFYYGTELLRGYIPAEYVIFRKEVVEEPKEPDKETPEEDEKPPEEQNPPDENKPEEGTDEKPSEETPPEEKPQDGVLDFTESEGEVTGQDFLAIRSTAGYDGETLKDPKTGEEYILRGGQKVTAYEARIVDGVKWYLVTYMINGNLGAGYVPAEYIKLTSDNIGPVTPGGITALDDAQFEKEMIAQGFPESYKPYLRELHKKFPYWQFKADQLGLDWNIALEQESQVGLNLITNEKNIAWKSTESGAYNWLTDKFVPYDGTTWVTASKEAIAYYMDPRNFLNENGIFQFELLSYQENYQTATGVENILKDTPMSNTSYTYIDSSNQSQTISYGTTFMEAAKYSGVSPYHLATRVKQEVVTAGSIFSSSATGKVNGYEGIYNFYNIGATHSTVAGGSVLNALNYAKNGGANNTTTFKNYIMIPWTNPYRAIIGGAAFIGYDYIKKGQDTVYLEKFNMTSNGTYSHQYMSNVEAASAEAAKTYVAYQYMLDVPIVFSIPVYENMPQTVCQAPVNQKNPNNWLKELKVEGFTLTPTFEPSIEQTYSLIVDNSVSKITISAKTASSKATILGTGEYSLNTGQNVIEILVTAENGEVKVYQIQIIREN